MLPFFVLWRFPNSVSSLQILAFLLSHIKKITYFLMYLTTFITESQYHKMVEVGKNVWMASCPNPLLKEGNLEQETNQKCFLIFRRNLLCFSSCPLPCFHSLFRYLNTLVRSPWALSPGWTPLLLSLSFPSQQRCSSPFNHPHWTLHWTLSSTTTSLLLWGAQRWTQYSSCGLTSAKERERISLNPLATLLMQHRTLLTF